MRHRCHGRGRGFTHPLDAYFGGGFGPGEGGEPGFFGGGRFSAGRGPGRGGMRGGFGGHRHGPAFFGHMAEMAARVRGARMLSAEHLQLVILSLVEEKPRHGYEIIKAIEEKSSGVYKPSPGMIYPALTYLEEADLVVSSTEGAKKQIALTPEGKKHLDENREHVDRILAGLQEHGERMAHFKERMSEEQAIEEQWREMREDFREIRDELRQVLFSKFAASKDERKRVLEILKKAIKDIRKGSAE